MKLESRRIACGWAFLLSAVAGAALAGAQVDAVHAPDGNTVKRISSIYVPSVPGAPFTLTLSTEVIRPLADGSTITLQNHRLIARDSAGRVFEERRWLVPPQDANADRITHLQWSDPIKGEYYNCLAETLVCQLSTYHPLPAEVTPVAGPSMEGKAQTAVESLGVRTIEGLQVNGTRVTTTIEAGAVGNDKPLVVTKEFWFSPELKLNLIVRRDDPRSGTQIFTATRVTTGEPNPSLFVMPAGFHLVDHRRTVESRMETP